MAWEGLPDGESQVGSGPRHLQGQGVVWKGNLRRISLDSKGEHGLLSHATESRGSLAAGYVGREAQVQH